jgi:uncharacterized membrane protein
VTFDERISTANKGAIAVIATGTVFARTFHGNTTIAFICVLCCLALAAYAMWMIFRPRR